MKKVVLIVIVLVFGIGIFQIVNKGENKKEIERVNENKPPLDIQRKLEDQKDYKAKDFSLLNLKGEEVTLESLKGKNIMLNFWATWCPPCKEEMPNLEKLYKESEKDDDFEIVTINLGEGKKEVEGYMNEKGYTFPVLLDSEAEVGLAYGANVLPTTFLINKDGYVKKVVKGSMSFEVMKQYKEGLVKELY